MATQTTQVPKTSDTLDHYKGWSQPFGTFLAAAGWVRLTDTGTVDWGVIASVPAAGTWRDWEIFRPPAGTNQTAAPIYLKIEYCSQAIRLTVGQGTDGAGNLTGSTRVVTLSGLTARATNYTVLFAGDETYLTLAIWCDDSDGMFYVVERFRGSDGTANGEGYYVANIANGSAPVVAYYHPAGGVFAAPRSGSVAVLLDDAAASAAYGNNKPISPFYPALGTVRPPSLAWGACKTADGTDGETFAVTISGASRTMRVVAKSYPPTSQAYPVMRWE